MLELIKFFIGPFVDICKYVIYRDISTGDKGLDNLVACLIIAGLSYLSSEKFLKNMFDKNNYDYSINYYTENIFKFKQIRWNHFDRKEVHNVMITYFLENIPPYIAKKMNWASNLDYINNKITRNTDEKFIDRNLDILENRKIYTNKTINQEIFRIPIHIYTTKNNYLIYIDDEFIFYENEKDLEEFLNILNIQKVKERRNNELRVIYKYKKEILVESSIVYPDRNFDNWISIHKPIVQKYINRFINANKNGKSDFGGFGSYNLGVIIHGEPGTGKTMFIKSLANALQKDILIIDMKKIKTNKQFENIIKQNYKNCILAFDEFDSIKGVISRDRGEDDKNTLISNLETQKHKLLSVETSDKNDNIKNEIERLEKCIEEERDKLDIFNMLSILDGIEEYRGRVIVATTNHIDHIDPALIREGRFDFKFKLTKFRDEEIKQLLCKMFSDKEEIIQKRHFVNDKYTPVQIMNIAMSNDFDKMLDIITDK